MSSPTQPIDGTPDPPGEINQTVDDEENQSQNTSIRRIQKFRDYLAEYQVWFAQNEISQEVTREQQLRSYHRMAQGFLRVLTPYLTDQTLRPEQDDGDPIDYYWTNVDLGAFTIHPPNAIQSPSQRRLDHAVKNHDKGTLAFANPQINVDPKHYRVRGLADFAQADPDWTETWTLMLGPEVKIRDLRAKLTSDDVTIRDRDHRSDPVIVEKQVQLPKKIVDNAVTAMENFIRDIGMDIDFEEEEQQTKIDRELLEEVDEWRRKNVN